MGKIILCMLIDKHGHIKYAPQSFKPNDCDICVSNFDIGKIGKKTLFYTMLDFREEFAEETTWTTNETINRCRDSVVKIFTRVQDFYKYADEIQFAYKDELSTWDEELDMNDLVSFCKGANREYLGEFNGIKFFRYSIKSLDKQ